MHGTPLSSDLDHSQGMRMKSPSMTRSYSKRAKLVEFLSDEPLEDTISNHVAISMPTERTTAPLRTPSNKNIFNDTWMRSTAEFQRRDPNEKKIPSKDPTLDDDGQQLLSPVPKARGLLSRLRRKKKEKTGQKREQWAHEDGRGEAESQAVDVEDEEVDPGWCINFCMTSQSGKAKVTPWLLWRLLAVWAVLGLGFVAMTFVIIYNTTLTEREARVESACSNFASGMEQLFTSESERVQEFSDLVATFYIRNQPPTLTQQLFQAYSNSTKHNRKTVMDMSYAERVLAKNRAAFERKIGTCIRDAAGNCVAPKEEYAAILFRSYILQGEAMGREHLPLGLDGGSEPDLMMPIERARDLGVAGALSPPTKSVIIPGIQLFRVYPVYNVTPPENATTQELRDACMGYIVGTFNFTDSGNLLLLNDTYPLDTILGRIYDVTDPVGPLLVWTPLESPMPANGEEEYHSVYPIDVGDPGRKYELHCKRARKHGFPWIALEWSVAVLVLLGLSCYIIWAAVMGLQRMGRDYSRMKSLKERMAEAKLAAEAASRAKGAFLATMSHEIRTPMNGVIGMLNLLLGTRLDATQLDYVETARTSGRALCALINDVLDLSKIEAGHMELEAIPFQLGSEIDDVISMFAEKAREKTSIELAAMVQDSVPWHVIGDPLRFRQVLINLLGNAFKFTKSGHIFVTARIAEPYEMLDVPDEEDDLAAKPEGAAEAEREAGGGGWRNPDISREMALREHVAAAQAQQTQTPRQKSASAEKDEYLTLSGREASDSCNSWSRIGPLMDCTSKPGHRRDPPTYYAPGQVVRLVISCEDSGIGIPRWAKKGIFKPFTQADTSTTRLHGGTGIGLTICQRLVDMMGGKLCFVSRAGVGTTFYFDCYLEVAEPPPIPRTPSLSKETKLASQSLDLSSNQDAATQQTSSYGGSGTSTESEPDLEQRVLVVDHRPVRRAVLAWHLHRIGLEVDFCDSPEEAPAFLQAMAGAGSPETAVSSPDIFSSQRQLHSRKAEQSGSGGLEPNEVPTPRLSGPPHSVFASKHRPPNGSASSPGSGMSRSRSIEALHASPSSSSSNSSPTQTVEKFDAEHICKAYCAVFVDSEEVNIEYSGASSFEEAYQRALHRCAVLCGARAKVSGKLQNGTTVHGSLSGGATWHAPVVLLTRERGTEEVARKAGFDAIVLKPLRRGALSACLVQLFSGTGLARTPSGGIVAVGQMLGSGLPSSGTGSPPDDSNGQDGEDSLFLPNGKPGSGNGALPGILPRPMEVPIQEQGQTAALTALFSGKKLLVVDDNMVNRKVISKMLQRYGAKTDLVDSGIKAIQSCKQPHSYHLIFMDVQMPLMDGYEATREIRRMEREHDPTGALHVPIFALTADIVVGTREKCTDSGMDGFLSKPIEEDQLYRVIPPFFGKARSTM